MKPVARRFHIILAIVFVIGATMSAKWTSWWPHWTPLVSVGEAFMIASVLAFTVDRFVKEHFIYDVSRDVFHYIIGYDVPVELKNKIKELLQTEIIAFDKLIAIRIEPKGRNVTVTFRIEWKIRNLTSATRSYTPHFAVSDSHEPRFIGHGVASRTVNYSWDGDAVGKRVHAAGHHRQLTGETFELEPGSIAGDYIVKWQYSVTLPKEYFHVDVFGRTTIGVRVIVDHPASYDVTVVDGPVHAVNEWSSDRMFLQGEFVAVQWRLKQSEPTMKAGTPTNS